ncbi:phage portal protein [Corynebacterium striatum]|uniref:phage portal protein n=1 Tax=Corynebacterium striatum TaxID=43770 RepID=UPI0027B9529F|nr:phage portal protein [Corynebacterium striatum]
MGILDRILDRRRPRLDPPSDYVREQGGFDVLDIWNFHVDNMTVEDLYRTQPHLRTVTSFIARMVSTVSLHAYERQDDGGRVRVRDGELASVLRRSSRSLLMSDLLTQTVMDLCLYDEWIWAVGQDEGRGGEWFILPIPPRWISKRHFSDPWTFEGISIWHDGKGEDVFIPAENLIRHTGYNPNSLRLGVSPILALKDVLKQNRARGEYQSQLWDRGPRMAGFIERPMDAKWEHKDRQRFKADLRAQFAAGGSGAGGIALLEDGMKFTPHHLKASDEQVVEQTKLSLETVAQVYHVNPTMVGILDNANYSNAKEFRQSLYGDSLLPIMKGIEESINAFLLPMMGIDPSRFYVEFNMQERLRARFEEQAAVTSQAIGAPWMTVNEGREMNNLPKIDGGDELARPLNTEFGDSSDGGDENDSGPSNEEAPDPETDDEEDMS